MALECDLLRARWEKHKHAWTSRHPWLELLQARGRLGLGCAICRAGFKVQALESSTKVNPPNFFIHSTKSAQSQHFYRHQRSASHKSFASFLQRGGGDVADHQAPSAAEFRSTLDSVRNGAGIPVGRKKHAAMVACLGESVRRRYRKALLEAESTSVQQDVRKSQLLMRFCCADSDLNQTRGVLGQVDLVKMGFGLDATGVRAGSMFIVAKLDHVDGKSSGVLTSVRKTTELYAADAAGDEQLAGACLDNAR